MSALLTLNATSTLSSQFNQASLPTIMPPTFPHFSHPLYYHPTNHENFVNLKKKPHFNQNNFFTKNSQQNIYKNINTHSNKKLNKKDLLLHRSESFNGTKPYHPQDSFSTINLSPLYMKKRRKRSLNIASNGRKVFLYNDFTSRYLRVSRQGQVSLTYDRHTLFSLFRIVFLCNILTTPQKHCKRKLIFSPHTQRFVCISRNKTVYTSSFKSNNECWFDTKLLSNGYNVFTSNTYPSHLPLCRYFAKKRKNKHNKYRRHLRLLKSALNINQNRRRNKDVNQVTHKRYSTVQLHIIKNHNVSNQIFNIKTKNIKKKYRKKRIARKRKDLILKSTNAFSRELSANLSRSLEKVSNSQTNIKSRKKVKKPRMKNAEMRCTKKWYLGASIEQKVKIFSLKSSQNIPPKVFFISKYVSDNDYGDILNTQTTPPQDPYKEAFNTKPAENMQTSHADKGKKAYVPLILTQPNNATEITVPKKVSSNNNATTTLSNKFFVSKLFLFSKAPFNIAPTISNSFLKYYNLYKNSSFKNDSNKNESTLSENLNSTTLKPLNIVTTAKSNPSDHHEPNKATTLKMERVPIKTTMKPFSPVTKKALRITKNNSTNESLKVDAHSNSSATSHKSLLLRTINDGRPFFHHRFSHETLKRNKKYRMYVRISKNFDNKKAAYNGKNKINPHKNFKHTQLLNSKPVNIHRVYLFNEPKHLVRDLLLDKNDCWNLLQTSRCFLHTTKSSKPSSPLIRKISSNRIA